MTQAPEVRFVWSSILKQAHWRRSPGACFFVVVLTVLYGVIAAKLVIPSWGRRGMEQFHLTVNSYPLWLLQQPLPAMYNYGNEIWIGDRPRRSFPGHPTAAKYREYHTWVNHYPLRVATFNWTRDIILREEGYKYLTLRSRYRGQTIETVYFMDVRDGGIYMERIY